MSPLKKISFVLMALLVMFGLVAATFQPAAAATSTCKQFHTVERGEYLVMIARSYGTDWRALAEMNNLKNPSLIYPGQNLCVSTSGTLPVVIPQTGSSSSDVRVYALSVKEDQSVTLRGRYLVPDSRYTVYMGKYKAAPSADIRVGTIFTDKNGAFTTTFNLPKQLVDISQVAVSLYNGRGDVAGNWFINATLEGNTGGSLMPKFSFSIVSVDKNDTVRIKTNNLPANTTFDVLMGKAGSEGEKGYLAGSLRSSKGGAIKATFDIPSELEGRSKIDIRLENEKLNMVYYLTFENKDTK
jgi:LysM repeat protein